MIELARSLDGDSRAIRKQFEDEVEAPITAASEKNRRGSDSRPTARSVYPDATFTLRLNYGKVQGWVENGSAGRALHAPRPRVRARDRRIAVQDSRQLDEGQRSARHAHAVLHVDEQRHRRRQLRQPA